MSNNIARISQYRKRWAVIIGIDEYENFTRLQNAVNDAKRLADALRNLGFDEVIERYDRNATKNSILSLLIDDDQLPDKIDVDDRVLIFFAGHGITSTNKRDRSRTGYLAPSDGEMGKWNSLIEFNDLVQKIVKRMNAKHVLFLLDCCFSGIASLRSISTDHSAIPPMPTEDLILSLN